MVNTALRPSARMRALDAATRMVAHRGAWGLGPRRQATACSRLFRAVMGRDAGEARRPLIMASPTSPAWPDGGNNPLAGAVLYAYVGDA